MPPQRLLKAWPPNDTKQLLLLTWNWMMHFTIKPDSIAKPIGSKNWLQLDEEPTSELGVASHPLLSTKN